MYKDELQSTLFPIFVNLFLGMIQAKFVKEAIQFFNDQRYQFNNNFRDDLSQLE